MTIKPFYLFLPFLAALSGCSMMSVYEGGFDCSPGSGVGCKSISQVNNMINEGFLPKIERKEREEEDSQDCPTCKAGNHSSHSEEIDIWWNNSSWIEPPLPLSLHKRTS